jgi:hypothetical protein
VRETVFLTPYVHSCFFDESEGFGCPVQRQNMNRFLMCIAAFRILTA